MVIHLITLIHPAIDKVYKIVAIIIRSKFHPYEIELLARGFYCHNQYLFIFYVFPVP